MRTECAPNQLQSTRDYPRPTRVLGNAARGEKERTAIDELRSPKRELNGVLNLNLS